MPVHLQTYLWVGACNCVSTLHPPSSAHVCANVFQIGVTRVIIPRDRKTILNAAHTDGRKSGGGGVWARQRIQAKQSYLNDGKIQIFVLTSINKSLSSHVLMKCVMQGCRDANVEICPVQRAPTRGAVITWWW